MLTNYWSVLKTAETDPLKAGYSDFWSFKIKCIIKYRYVLVIQKKYYENFFCILRDIFSFKDFFNETTEYQLHGVRLRAKNI